MSPVGEGAQFAGGKIASVSCEPSIATVGDYVALMKPRVMSLVVFTALVSLLIAPGQIHPMIGFTALLCIAVGPGAALAFGIVLAAFAVGVLGVLVSWLAAALLAFTIFFYVVVYTAWLKRLTPQNIVIGGAAGSLPPVIAWAAATGGISVEPSLLFLIIFVWTPPHFWALSLVRVDDYARARLPMLPVVAGAEETRRQILRYSVALSPIGAAPWLLGYAQALYGVTALIAGALMVMFAWRVRSNREGERAERAAHQLFGFSILYLVVRFAVLLIDARVVG